MEINKGPMFHFDTESPIIRERLARSLDLSGEHSLAQQVRGGGKQWEQLGTLEKTSRLLNRAVTYRHVVTGAAITAGGYGIFRVGRWAYRKFFPDIVEATAPVGNVVNIETVQPAEMYR